MRARKYLLPLIAVAMIAAACQPGSDRPPQTFPPAAQPPGTSTTVPPTPTTGPPTTSTTTTIPPTTTTTLPPAVPISFLPDVAADMYQVFGVASGRVPVTRLPGDMTTIVTELDSAARNIETTGKRATVKNETWFEIKLTDGTKAWIDAQRLVHQITVLESAKPANFVVSGLTKGDKLNVRSNAGIDHPAVSALSSGETVVTTGHRAKVQGSVWMEIRLSKTTTGWVNASFLTPEVVFLADETPAIYQVTGLESGSLNVRKRPGTHTDVLAVLRFDATDIATTGKRAQAGDAVWRQIKMSDGTVGWVSDAFVKVQPAPTARACRPDSDSFCPDLGATRGTVAAFISRAAGLTDTGGKDWFTDDNGSPFEADLNRLAAAGIIKGCNPPDNTKACPDELASRATSAAWFSRALSLTDDGGKNWFSDDEGSAYEADINRLAAAGVTRACNSDGTKFCPNETLGRGQLAAWTVRAFNLPASTTDFFADDDASPFEDAINAVAAARITRL